LIFGRNPQEPSRFRLLLTGLVAEAAGDAAAAAPSVEWAELAAVEARVAKSHMKPINSRVCCMSLSVLLELAERLALMGEAMLVALYMLGDPAQHIRQRAARLLSFALARASRAHRAHARTRTACTRHIHLLHHPYSPKSRPRCCA
jgi:hypothetical protein